MQVNNQLILSRDIPLDLLVGGMPRGGTTVAAKLMSLHPDIFCYAGETHLIPFMYDMFGQLPCRQDKLEPVAKFLHQQFNTAMVEMPRFSVGQGAHPGNLIFEERDVNFLVEEICKHLSNQLYGLELYKASLLTLRELLANSKAGQRIILGEKTPDNIFAMAEYAGQCPTKSMVVMREPIGVLRSMKARVEGGDPYSNAFKGDLENNIGMYLEYAKACQQVLNTTDSLFVRYEDMALKPAAVVREMYRLFEREADERVIKFVESGRDREIADRAPMNYRRLGVTVDYSGLSQVDAWKIFSFTKTLREAFGYSDEEMAQFGFAIPTEWPDVEVPARILPMSGFHLSEGAPWMKRRGCLVMYVGKGRSHEVTLDLVSNFPGLVQEVVELQVIVNGAQRDVLNVGPGTRNTKVNLRIHSDDLIPMGNKGGYVVFDLISSVAFTQIGHTAEGMDAREMSFQLSGWSINKSSTKWWQFWG